MRVWVVIRDDGNSQEAEDSVDSMWWTRARAEKRVATMVAETRPRHGVRIEKWKVGKVGPCVS